MSQDARDLALKLLARRDYSRRELSLRLHQRAGYPAEVVDALLSELEATGLLCEQRRAESLSRRRLQQGYGPGRIAAELRQLGLAGTLPDAATEVEAARTALRRRYGPSPPTDPRDGLKRAQFLIRRGFPSELARRLVACAGDEPEQA